MNYKCIKCEVEYAMPQSICFNCGSFAVMSKFHFYKPKNNNTNLKTWMERIDNRIEGLESKIAQLIQLMQEEDKNDDKSKSADNTGLATYCCDCGNSMITRDDDTNILGHTCNECGNHKWTRI
jgi:predicted RNA-binding Zn-ribbon protein involved in translation (DUF1610 family)